MTVLEVIKQYGLEDYDKYYFNVYGNCIDTKYPIDVLAKMDVKSVRINFKIKDVEITIIED